MARPPKERPAPAAPLIPFSLTFRCGCSCRMCCAGRCQGGASSIRRRDELDTAGVKAVIDRVDGYYADRVGRPGFYLTGGEPFCRADILEILHHLSARGHLTLVNTTLDGVCGELLADLPGDTILIVSLHGDEETHGEITGRRELYGGVVAHLEQLAERGAFVRLNCVVSRYNHHGLAAFYAAIRHLGLPITFQHVMWCDEEHAAVHTRMVKDLLGLDARMEPNAHCTLDPDQVAVLRRELEAVRELAGADNVLVQELGACAESYDRHYCSFVLEREGAVCAEAPLRIRPDGSVGSCFGAVFGNLRGDSVETILAHPRRVEHDRVVGERLRRGRLFPLCVKCCLLRTGGQGARRRTEPGDAPNQEAHRTLSPTA